MSDNYITIIPEICGHIPASANQDAIMVLYRQIFSSAWETNIVSTPELRFIDCGENFEGIQCPYCKATIEMTLWNQWMDHDYQGDSRESCVDQGFQLEPHFLSCCSQHATLHEFQYIWQQGFARWEIHALNPDSGELEPEQLHAIESELGCKARVIYQHY